MMTRWKAIGLVMAVCSIGAGPGTSARAVAPSAPAGTTMTTQAPAQESRTTVQLLEEVRALRAAIEKMTVAGTRAQLLLGRLQMQEQRMTNLGQQVQDTRARLGALQRDRQNHATELDLISERVERAATPEERLQSETGLKAVKQAMAHLDRQVAALQSEDAGLSQALSTEQSRWMELNGRLEELEGLLAAQKP